MNRVLALFLALCLPAGCAAAGTALPVVDGPIPQLESAPAAATQPVAILRLPKSWDFYSNPPEQFGVPVLKPEGDTEWEVTGRWRAARRPAGSQYWVLMGGIFTWYRLAADVEPWGRVHLWGLVPDDWVHGDRTAVPTVEPSWGEPWRTVPYSRGHVLAPLDDGHLALHACPDPACPVLERPVTDQTVPVTGRLTDDAGREWYRVEFRQTILWAEAGSGSLAQTEVVWLQLQSKAAGYRSCEPLVMFPPPPHTICLVDGDGRYLNDSEREYDDLDPVFGRLRQPVVDGAD